MNRPGFTFVCELPPGYDERTRIAFSTDTLFLLHPEHPVVAFNKETRQFEEVALTLPTANELTTQ